MKDDLCGWAFGHGVSYLIMSKSTITVLDGHLARRGTRISLSSHQGSETFWVVGTRNSTEMVVASSWRDSLWVPWFQFVNWVTEVWASLCTHFKR